MSRNPETLIPVANAPGHTAAHAMASALRDAGIEAFVFDTAKTALQWEAPAVIAPYQVHVRRSDADRAAEILEDNRADSVDIDWDEIDVGQPADETAARIAGQFTAPWIAARPGRPVRDAAFRMTGIGIVAWLVGIGVVALASFVLVLIRIF